MGDFSLSCFNCGFEEFSNFNMLSQSSAAIFHSAPAVLFLRRIIGAFLFPRTLDDDEDESLYPDKGVSGN